ncbi:MAG: CPBP family intramembrane metalloprotease [Rhodocyclaceae bacterium]|nr:CPBP family intramembrane metalloprotease [Rhodocyclaceae bacterium]
MDAQVSISANGNLTATLGQRILRFPLTRIVLGVAFFMVPFLLIQGFSTNFLEVKLHSRIGQLSGAFVGCLSYAFYVTKIEKRAVTELALNGALKEYSVGFVLGALMVCLTVASIAALGGISSIAVAPNTIIVLPLLMQVTVGLIEEMLLRGIFFRVVQESLGSWLALLASGMVFGALHLVNDNISVLAIANIAVVGVFFAAAYLLTGRLWLCAALHAGWNFAQGSIFSLAVSGHEAKSGLFTTQLTGPDWLTGGAFGLEGSAVDLVLVIFASAVMVKLAQLNGPMMAPVWKR